LVLIVVFALLLTVPLYWMVKTSFTHAVGILKMPPDWFPVEPVLSNYAKLFAKHPVGRWMWNSTIVVVGVVGLGLLINTGAGYAFAKKRFPGRKIVFWSFLASMMLPGQVTLIPGLLLIRKLHLYNTLWAMIVPCLMSPFLILFYRSYLSSFPGSALEAAEIDGCDELTKFFRIVWPLTTPALATIAVLTFCGTWNNFLWHLGVTTKPKLRTLPVGMAIATIQPDQFLGEFGMVDWGGICAGATVTFVPMLLIFILAQKHFVQSLYAGGLR